MALRANVHARPVCANAAASRRPDSAERTRPRVHGSAPSPDGIHWASSLGRDKLVPPNQSGGNAAMTLSSIAIGVGKAPTSTVVRVGFGLAAPAKYSG